MYQGKLIAGAVRHITAVCLAALVLAVAPLSCAFAAQPAKSTASGGSETTPAKVHELLTLLADPKVQEWLDAGAGLVWVVNPRRRLVTVHRPGVAPVILTTADTLDGLQVVPGFTLPVADIFV